MVMIKKTRHLARGNELVQSVEVEECTVYKWVNPGTNLAINNSSVRVGGTLRLVPSPVTK